MASGVRKLSSEGVKFLGIPDPTPAASAATPPKPRVAAASSQQSANRKQPTASPSPEETAAQMAQLRAYEAQYKKDPASVVDHFAKQPVDVGVLSPSTPPPKRPAPKRPGVARTQAEAQEPSAPGGASQSQLDALQTKIQEWPKALKDVIAEDERLAQGVRGAETILTALSRSPCKHESLAKAREHRDKKAAEHEAFLNADGNRQRLAEYASACACTELKQMQETPRATQAMGQPPREADAPRSSPPDMAATSKPKACAEELQGSEITPQEAEKYWHSRIAYLQKKMEKVQIVKDRDEEFLSGQREGDYLAFFNECRAHLELYEQASLYLQTAREELAKIQALQQPQPPVADIPPPPAPDVPPPPNKVAPIREKTRLARLHAGGAQLHAADASRDIREGDKQIRVLKPGPNRAKSPLRGV